MVSAEMDNFEPGVYSDRVLEAVKLLQTDVIPNFSKHVDSAAGYMGEGYKVMMNAFSDLSAFVLFLAGC